jgi:hypothetical protein
MTNMSGRPPPARYGFTSWFVDPERVLGGVTLATPSAAWGPTNFASWSSILGCGVDLPVSHAHTRRCVIPVAPATAERWESSPIVWASNSRVHSRFPRIHFLQLGLSRVRAHSCNSKIRQCCCLCKKIMQPRQRRRATLIVGHFSCPAP